MTKPSLFLNLNFSLYFFSSASDFSTDHHFHFIFNFILNFNLILFFSPSVILVLLPQVCMNSAGFQMLQSTGLLHSSVICPHRSPLKTRAFFWPGRFMRLLCQG